MTAVAHTLLIGGSGFVGSAIRAHLDRAGRPCLVATRSPAVGDPTFIGYATLDRIIPRSIDTIVDLTQAWGKSPEASLALAVANLDLVRQLRPRRYLFVSSGGAIYGNAASLPIAEDAPIRPQSDYGRGKLLAEMEVRGRIAAGLPGIIVRPANAYGPGHRPGGGQGLVTAAFASVLNRAPLTIFGDGSQVRDYLHVDDLAAAIVASVDHGTDGATYNIGTGVGTSVTQLLDRVQALAAPIDVDWQPCRVTDVDANVLDSRRLEADTDWSPTVTLTDGLSTTWLALRGKRS